MTIQMISVPYSLVSEMDKKGKNKLYRQVPIEKNEEEYVYFQVRQNTGLKQHFTFAQDGSVLANAVPVEDTVSTPRMQAYRQWLHEVAMRRAMGETVSEEDARWPGHSTENERKRMEEKWNWVASLFEGRSTIQGRPAADFFKDIAWQQKVFKTIAETNRVETRDVKLAYFLCVEYGGDQAALLSKRGDFSGAAGEDRPAKPGSSRTGAPQPDSILYSHRSVKRLGMDEQQRRNVIELAKDTIRSCWDERKHEICIELVCRRIVDHPREFWRKFVERYFIPSQSVVEKNNRPSEDMVDYHRRKLVERDLLQLIEEIQRSMRVEAGLPPEKQAKSPYIPKEAPSDMGGGIFEIIQLDGKVFGRIMIYKKHPETGELVDIGCARVILACGQNPDIILGWYASALPENGQAYRFCLYNTFSDKKSRLRQLGLDPELFPGIVRGFAHCALFDKGPARGKKVALFVPSAISLAAALTFSGTPQHKGGIERTNRRVEDEVYRVLEIGESVKEAVEEETDALPAGRYTLTRLLRTLRKKEERKNGAGFIRMELRTFERLLVECINKLNLEREQGILAYSLDDLMSKSIGTRAELYEKKRQRIEEMDGPSRMNDRRMQHAMLEVTPAKVTSLKVCYGGREFGAYAGDNSEEAVRFVEYIENWKLRRRLGQLTPEEISDRGKPVIKVTMPPYGTGLMWLPPGDGEEWLELPETLDSCKTFGERPDYADVDVVTFLFNAKKAEAGRSDPNAISQSTKESVRQDNLDAREAKSWEASPDLKRRTKKEQAKSEAKDRYAQPAADAGIPSGDSVKAPSSAPLAAKLPIGSARDEAATKRILDRIIAQKPGEGKL